MFCLNTEIRDMHKKQCGLQKQNTEVQIGNWIQYCRNREIAICTKKWDIIQQENYRPEKNILFRPVTFKNTILFYYR